MTSAISCIALGPVSFLSISHSITNEMQMKTMLVTQAENEIKLEVELDTLGVEEFGRLQVLLVERAV